MTVTRGALAVVHLPPALLQLVLEAGRGLEPSGVLLRADISSDRALLALTVRDLISRDLDIAVLKRRLGWAAERRALFGVLPTDARELPRYVRRNLLSSECYADSHDAESEPAC